MHEFETSNKNIFRKTMLVFPDKLTTNTFYLKNHIKNIAQENLYMYKRIVEAPATYDKIKWLQDYKQSQIYKRNACKFPSINFLKTHKKKKNLSANLYKKNKINDRDNLVKTTTRKQKINCNSVKNENNNTKIKFYKNKKKKIFEEFDIKDLINMNVHKSIKLKKSFMLENQSGHSLRKNH